MGTRSEIPNPAITKTEIVRKTEDDTPLILTMVERKRVKKVKLAINPNTTPTGREIPVFFPPIVEERTIGRTGKIQGESIVTIPAKNAKTTRMNIS